MKRADDHSGDFTRENYKRILEKASHYFHIHTIERFIQNRDVLENGRVLLLRHDVDHSTHSAVKMAKIESEIDVSSTFFINIHSRFYNFFEDEVFENIKKIKELGHEIGIHLDSQFYDLRTEEELNDKLFFEKHILEKALDLKIKSFSFHNTTGFSDNCTEERYGGVYNVGSETFRKTFKYCSDSNGYWRFDRLEDLLDQKGNFHLQVLIHPGWWERERMTPKERVLRKIMGRAKKHIIRYERVLTDFQRKDEV